MTVVVAQNLIQIIPIILITATTRQNRGQDNKEAKISHRIEDRLGKVKFSRMNRYERLIPIILISLQIEICPKSTHLCLYS